MFGQWGIAMNSGKGHIIPIEDLRDHDLKADCWCRPVPDIEDPLFTHNALDGREAYERGERLPC